MNKTLIIFGILALILVGGLLIARRPPETPQTSAPQVSTQEFKRGEKVQDLTLVDFDGNVHKLSDYLGKAVVLDFWAAWCPFCVAEMPELQAAQDKYKEDLVMIGVHRTDTANQSPPEKSLQMSEA